MATTVGNEYWNLNDGAKDIYYKILIAKHRTCGYSSFGGHGFEDFFHELDNAKTDDQIELIVFTMYSLFCNVGYYCPKHILKAIYEKEIKGDYQQYLSEEMFLNAFKFISNFSPMPISWAAYHLNPLLGILAQVFESIWMENLVPAHNEHRKTLEEELNQRLEEIGDRYRSNHIGSSSDALLAYEALKLDNKL